MDDAQKPSRQVQVKASDELSMGRYSNTLFVAHGPEEFILDWLLNSPSGEHLVPRIIVTPGNVKRIINALSDNLKKYEEKYGEIRLSEPADQPFH